MKKVLLEMDESTHAKLKEAANIKGMKFYAFILAELGKVAKREERKTN